MIEDEEQPLIGRRPVWRWVVLGLLLLILAILLGLWLSRVRIATGFVEREFERRGVQASYEVTRVGFRTQRIENLVIGNPARPDLTARWVEVDVTFGWRKLRADLIRARGVRLHGRIENGRVRFGQVDKLLPPPSGKPFRLPNQRVEVADVALRLDTPTGRIGASIEGKGNLAYSFEGKIAAVSHRLAFSDKCRLETPALYADVTTDEEQPTVRGPLRASSIDCGGVLLTQPLFTVDTRLSPGFDSARGGARVQVAQLRSGAQAVRGISGRVTFDGSASQVRGRMNLAALGVAASGYRAGRATIDGRYVVAPEVGNVSLLTDIAAAGITGAGASLAPVQQALASTDGTPIEPIAAALSSALGRAGQSLDARGTLRFVNGRGYSAVRLQDVQARSRSGARLVLSGGDGFTYYWPAERSRIEGDLALSGGGFPLTRFSLAQPRVGSPIRGTATIAPMAAGDARLQLAPIRFTAAAGGATSIDTTASISGPFKDGRVDGLVVPINGRLTGGGGFAFGERCTPVSFRFLKAAGLRIGPTRLPLCPTGRALVWRSPGGGVQAGADVRAPRLVGRLGQSPISFASSRVRLSLAEPGFTSSDVAVRLGAAGAQNRLDLATLSGRFNSRGVIGSFAGGDAKLNNVPLILSQGRGTWSVLGGDVTLDGSLSVADEADPARFHPLVTNDFNLTLVDNQIVARGWLVDPETGTRVSETSINHALRTGRGNAVLDIPGIRFDEDYQPEQLTRLTTGVVALVNGVLKGQGRINWGPEGTTSTGAFSTENMSLAAAFGPVERLSTTINFTDLLGLQTAPAQVANVGVIRTGIDVFDGLIRYQLLPGLRVRVESGRWPFAGGELLLEETILDFSQPTTKRLVFRVVGLDAARFVQQMEFSNITATGTFDGIIPMEFDQGGGRIVGGQLIARPEGGTLSYIGELTDKQLGVYGKLAFDALKSLRYNKLTIVLNGALDGEFVAGIELDGIARDPELTTVGKGGGIRGMVARRALSQLAKIPFEFNITIRGPFRTLLGTARSLEDPTLLIQSVLPQVIREAPTTTTVQPKESEIVR